MYYEALLDFHHILQNILKSIFGQDNEMGHAYRAHYETLPKRYLHEFLTRLVNFNSETKVFASELFSDMENR